MPIYRFRCPDCLKEEEVILLMANRNDTRVHSCGAVMERLMSIPCPAIFKIYGKDTVLKTLNKEDGHGFPGGDKHRPRYEQTMAKGLNPVKPVIGRGF